MLSLENTLSIIFGVPATVLAIVMAVFGILGYLHQRRGVHAQGKLKSIFAQSPYSRVIAQSK